MFLEAARQLGVEPRRSIVVEDAIAGVQAGKRGGFGLVIGIARAGNFDELRKQGADLVVEDLEQLLPQTS
jgi:beta-phosphoglucomutase-like phosphatase (HAD superfamily)